MLLRMLLTIVLMLLAGNLLLALVLVALDYISALRRLDIATTLSTASQVPGRLSRYPLLKGRLIALPRVVQSFGPTAPSHQPLCLVLERLAHIDHARECPFLLLLLLLSCLCKLALRLCIVVLRNLLLALIVIVALLDGVRASLLRQVRMALAHIRGWVALGSTRGPTVSRK